MHAKNLHTESTYMYITFSFALSEQGSLDHKKPYQHQSLEKRPYSNHGNDMITRSIHYISRKPGTLGNRLQKIES